MARHWSRFVGGLSNRQAYALDKMAEEAGIGDGMDLLMRLTGYNRSRIGNMDYRSLRKYVNEAFRQYGRDSVG